MKEKENELQHVRPPFKATAERQRLVERMLDMKIDEVLNYRDITALTGEKAQSERGLAIIRSAKKAVRNEYHRVFVNLRNVGLKRLADEEIVEHVGTVLVAVRRKVKVGAHELQCVSYAELPLEKRTEYQLNQTLLHYVSSLVSNESQKNVKALIASQSEDPQVGNVLQLFQIQPPKKAAG